MIKVWIMQAIQSDFSLLHGKFFEIICEMYENGKKYIYEFRLAIEKITRLHSSALGLIQTWSSFLFNRFVVEFPISLSSLRVFPGIIWERWTYFLTSRYLKEYIKYYFFALKNEKQNVLKFGANEKPTMKKRHVKYFIY